MSESIRVFGGIFFHFIFPFSFFLAMDLSDPGKKNEKMKKWKKIKSGVLSVNISILH
jgi:hypothetical protein